MQNIETITKIIANIMAVTAIPTLAISIAKYYYDKNKDAAERIRKGYLPLYEYFFKKVYSQEFVKKEIAFLTRSSGNTLFVLIKDDRIVDKSVLPFKLVKLLYEYEFYMDIIDTGLGYINAYEKSIKENDINNELDEILKFKENVMNYYDYGVVLHEEYANLDDMEGIFASDYIGMIDKSINHIVRLHDRIEKYVFKSIGKPKYYINDQKTILDKFLNIRRILKNNSNPKQKEFYNDL